MKRVIPFLLFLLAYATSPAQILDPVKWTFTVEAGKNQDAVLVFKAKMDAGWHIYSQNTPDGGPLPMVFKFDAKPCYEADGNVTEPKPHEEFDSTFGVKVLIFDKEVSFRQKIKLKGDACKITGTVEFQACKEACIFLEKKFSFIVGKSK
jgi:DsbC/DsbD-like thiol-disulfide interchange protein